MMAWTKEKTREYMKEFTRRRREKHLCLSCGTKTDGKLHCVRCNARRCDQVKLAREIKKEKGLCIQCGHIPKDGQTRCSKCLGRKNVSYKKRRQDLIDQGLCGKCGNKTFGKKSCESCLTKVKKWERLRKKALMDAGLCCRCGKKSSLVYASLCQICYLKSKSRSHLKAGGQWKILLTLLNSQNWRCPYTGEKLILGLNDSIDHKLPRIKFPKQALDISNLEWITRGANQMKADRTPDEFLALIKQIYNYRSLQLEIPASKHL